MRLRVIWQVCSFHLLLTVTAAMFACLVALVVSSCLKLGFPFVQHPGVLFLFLFVFPFVMWDIQRALIRLGLNQYLPRAFYF
jgi:hypothetical protein